MPHTRGVNGLDVKNKNRGLVLRMVACGKANSRKEIAKKTGLTKMTVSNIVNELIEAGFLWETEYLEEGMGRRPVALELSAYAPRILGIYLSRDGISAALMQLNCQLEWEERVEWEQETPESVEKKLLEITHHMLKKNNGRLLGIGVASLGPLGFGHSVLLNPTNFFGVDRLDIKGLLEFDTQLPVAVNHDSSAAALAEKYFGVGQDYEDFVYLGIANGISAGIITDGRLYQEESGLAGEIGHMSIQSDGPMCPCGNRGCLETFASIPVIQQALRDAKDAELSVSPREFRALYEDPACRQVFEEAADKLAAGVVNLCNLLAPQAVILGHDGYFLPGTAMDHMEERINERVIFRGHKEIRVMFSAFEDRAPLFGAVCTVLDRLFAGALPLHQGLGIASDAGE